jgi:hypothetical protein
MEMANLVLAIRLSRAAAGIWTRVCGMTGRAGKFSLAIPTSLYFFFSLTQKADEFQKFLGGDSAGAFFLDLGFTRGPDAKLQVRSGNGEAGAFGLDEQVGENRDGGLALNDTLRGVEFGK